MAVVGSGPAFHSFLSPFFSTLSGWQLHHCYHCRPLPDARLLSWRTVPERR
jgi:hypothetical protein